MVSVDKSDTSVASYGMFRKPKKGWHQMFLELWIAHFAMHASTQDSNV